MAFTCLTHTHTHSLTSFLDETEFSQLYYYLFFQERNSEKMNNKKIDYSLKFK